MRMREMEKTQASPLGAKPNEDIRSDEGEKRGLATLSFGDNAPETGTNGVGKRGAIQAHRAYLLLAIVVAIGLVAWGGYAFLTRNIETTDDAFIEADVVALSPRVGGQVLRVNVTDNQLVRKDELLIEIDPEPFEARLKQAEAELSIARANAQGDEVSVSISNASADNGRRMAKTGVSNAETNMGGADAQVFAAEAALERAAAQTRKAEADLERARRLAKSGVIPGVDLEHREREVEVTRAQLKEAKAHLSLAREQAHAASARVKGAEAVLDLARIDLDGTRVVATVTGRITRLAVRPGQMVQPGQLLLYLVPEERYVVANFKETQVGRIKPGQAVEIEIDAYPGRLFQAKVESLMAGTGSRFSLLPADNATGNFVKVVQRVPVRIAWQGEPPDILLAPGMSVFVKVHVGESQSGPEGPR